MDIEKRLKEDAARYKNLQPPAHLSNLLKTGLEGVARPTTGRWFKPAMAVLTAALLAVALLPELGLLPTKYAATTEGVEPTEDYTEVRAPREGDSVSREDLHTKSAEPQPIESYSDTKKTPAEDKTIIATGFASEAPWARIGVFSGLALLGGAFWCREFWRRRRFALALLAPAGALVLGNVWLLRNILF